jgi:hypothetical protein
VQATLFKIEHALFATVLLSQGALQGPSLPLFRALGEPGANDRLFKREHHYSEITTRVKEISSQPPFHLRWDKRDQVEPITTLLFTIEISATYRGVQEIYSAQVIARNGEKLYHVAEALSISEAVEQIVKQMKLQEKHNGSFK